MSRPTGRGGLTVTTQHDVLDGHLCFVRELMAVAVQKFYAVVFEWIVRGRHDHAEISAELPREHGHSRSRNLAREQHIYSRGIQSRRERRLQHLARCAGIAPEHAAHTLAAGFFSAQHHGGGLTEAQDELWRHGVTIGHGTHAVGAEELALF